MIRRILFLAPVLTFAVLVGFLGWRLVTIERGNTPDIVPSVMINKPAPEFGLPPLLAGKAGLTLADLKGKVTIINFFASWCVPCRAEHPLLEAIKGKGAVLAGIAYKNKKQDAEAWLNEFGDPYDRLADDPDGRTAIDFGLYGVPETYVIDRDGIIRFKQTGPLTQEIIRDQLLPVLKGLEK